MSKRMLIDGNHPEEVRVVITSGNRLEEYDIETSTKTQLKGNIYLAKVTRVEPSLQAAFVDYGGNRHGFLAFSEIHPDYYQIPIADREALAAEARAETARRAEEPEAPVERAEAAEGDEENGEIVGVFTRTDLYQKDAPEPGLPEGILEALPSGVQEVLRFLAERFPKATFYLVGGAVRDALLGAAGPDVDLVVVGEKPEAVARALVERLGGRYRVHPAFLTAEVELKGGLHVDLAAPREEHYPRPGALPRVRPP